MMKKNGLAILFIAAFLIRLIGLNQSLWLDEATTARVVQTLSFSEIVSKFSPSDFHPPLYYLFMKIWTLIFGASEISLRMPSVIFSLLTGWIVYLIGGIWAAAFFLFNPLVVYYSQEARMYMMTTFFLTTSLYFLISSSRNLSNPQLLRRNAGVKQRGPQNFDFALILSGVFASLGFLTFYGSVFFIAAMYLWLLFKKQYRVLFVSCILFLVSSLLVSPLLYQQIQNAQKSITSVANWKQVLGTVNIKNLALIPLKFSVGRISFDPKKLYYLISGAWALLVFYFVFYGVIIPRGVILNSVQDLRSRNKFGMTLGILFAVPIIIGLLASFITPLLQYFRFLYLIPIMSLLLSFGADKNRQRITLISGFIIFSLIYIINPVFHREDWKSLAMNLPKEETVYMIYSSSDPLKYYLPDADIKDIREIERLKEKSLIIIPYTSQIHGVDYEKILTDKNFSLKKVYNFRQVYFENWIKNEKNL